MKVLIVCAISLVSMAVSLPLPQSSLDHLIIPYDDSPVDYGVFSSDNYDSKDEPAVITSYNVGTFRQGDYLHVPLGASYTVGGPSQLLKKGSVVETKRFSLTRPGLVL